MAGRASRTDGPPHQPTSVLPPDPCRRQRMQRCGLHRQPDPAAHRIAAAATAVQAIRFAVPQICFGCYMPRPHHHYTARRALGTTAMRDPIQASSAQHDMARHRTEAPGTLPTEATAMATAMIVKRPRKPGFRPTRRKRGGGGGRGKGGTNRVAEASGRAEQFVPSWSCCSRYGNSVRWWWRQWRVDWHYRVAVTRTWQQACASTGPSLESFEH